MADNDDVTGNAGPDVTPPEEPATGEPTTVSQPVAPGATTASPVLKTRWRDRAWSFRALLAVALAMFVIGGIGGLVVGVAAAHHHDRNDGFYYRMGPGGGMPPGWRMHRGPGWRWDDGGRGRQWKDGPQPPQLTPYGAPGSSGPTASTPSPSAPGSTG